MAFTTERKGIRKTSINIARKGSIVKERCRQLAEIALELSTDRRISEEDLAYLVERYIGSDKETVRAYLGYYGAIKHRSSGEGYAVGLSRKGYLEKFDFMHRARRVWVIHAQVKFPIAPIPYQNNDEVVCSESKEQIYLSFSQGERARENRFEKVVSLNVLGGDGVKGGRKKEEEYREIEKFYSKDCPKIPELTAQEQAILTAKPTDKDMTDHS